MSGQVGAERWRRHRSGRNGGRALLYREFRWNLPLAAYMAFRGFACFGVVPMVVVVAAVPNDGWTVALSLAVALPAAAVPFVRTLLGGVWQEGDVVAVRNPFRTLRFERADVARVEPTPLWQNFFVVAGVELFTSRRRRKVVPVPATDVTVFAEALRGGT